MLTSKEGLAHLGEAVLVIEGRVEARNADVLLTGALLRLDEARSTLDAHDERARDLGVKGAAVASLLDLQDAADPRDDLVRGGVRGLVQVDDAVANVIVERALEGGVAIGQRSVVASAHVELIVVLVCRNGSGEPTRGASRWVRNEAYLKEQGPLRAVKGGGDALRLDEEISALLHVRDALGLSLFLVCKSDEPHQPEIAISSDDSGAYGSGSKKASLTSYYADGAPSWAIAASQGLLGAKGSARCDVPMEGAGGDLVFFRGLPAWLVGAKATERCVHASPVDPVRP